MGGPALGGTTMAAMRDWARSLVVLVLLGSCIDLVLPQNGYRGYVRMVLGLLMILAMLGPILALTGQDQGQALTAAMAEINIPAPDVMGRADPAQQVARLRTAQESLVRTAVQQRLAAEAVGAALSVPGVATARAEVGLAAMAADEPAPNAAVPVAWVRVTVVTGTTGAMAPVVPVAPVLVARSVADASAAARGPGWLVSAVRQAVAERLEVPAGSVQVAESAAGGPAVGR